MLQTLFQAPRILIITIHRRKYLEAFGGTVAATTLAGCSGILNGYGNMAEDGTQISLDPAASVLTPDDLPEEERNPWIVTRDESGTKSYDGERDYADRLLEVENEGDIQWLEGSWRHLHVVIQVFEKKK